MKLFTRDQLILSKGIAASILLHGAIIGFVFSAQHNNSNAEQAITSQVPRTYLVVTTSQRRPAEKNPAAELTGIQPPLPITRAVVTPQELRRESEQVEPYSSVTESLVATAVVSPGIDQTTTTEESPSAGMPMTSGDEAGINRGSMRAAVTAYVQRQRGSYSQQWTSACVIYQKEHGVQDCPQQQDQDYSGHKEERTLVTKLMNDANRTQRYTRMTEQFMAENKELKKLMEGSDPVLAELARTRHSLNREYITYLNGNFDFKTWAFVQTANSNMGNLAYISNFMQASCNPSPCVWEYNGFTVVKPEVEESVTEPEFKISTTVLGTKK
ncbi:MAG: hypothetical protein V4628_13330 [Pseudomonadota bacterium]